MSKSEFITTAMARLVVAGSTPRDIAIRTLWLAIALWEARELRSWNGFDAEAREFIDMAALSQPAGVINFTTPKQECTEEARKRYEIATQRWVVLRLWKDDPTYFLDSG